MPTMLEEKLQQIEEKVGALLEELTRQRKTNAELRDQMDAERAKHADEVASLKMEVDQLEERRDDLQKQVEEANAKEESVRERLRGIIEKIDSLEEAVSE